MYIHTCICLLSSPHNTNLQQEFETSTTLGYAKFLESPLSLYKLVRQPELTLSNHFPSPIKATSNPINYPPPPNPPQPTRNQVTIPQVTWMLLPRRSLDSWLVHLLPSVTHDRLKGAAKQSGVEPRWAPNQL